MNLQEKVIICGGLATSLIDNIHSCSSDIEIVEVNEAFKPEPMKITNSYKDLSMIYHHHEPRFTKKERKCNNSKRPKPRKKK